MNAPPNRRGGSRNPRATRGFTALAAAPGLIICLVLAACQQSDPAHLAYQATIARVEQPDGVFYSPRLGKGSMPLTLIYLRLRGEEGSAGASLLRIAVLGPYEPARFGRPGDSVSFEYAGNPHQGGELAYEDLWNYEVALRGGKPAG